MQIKPNIQLTLLAIAALVLLIGGDYLVRLQISEHDKREQEFQELKNRVTKLEGRPQAEPSPFMTLPTPLPSEGANSPKRVPKIVDVIAGNEPKEEDVPENGKFKLLDSGAKTDAGKSNFKLIGQ